MPTLPDITVESHEEFLISEYKNVQKLIFQYDQAISAVLTGNVSSYKLDSGQSSQSLVRLPLSELEATQKQLLKRLDNLASRLGYNRSVVVVTPGF